MKLPAKIALATLVLVFAGWQSQTPLFASGRLTDPQTAFLHGLRWTERNSDNHGVMQLKPGGEALIHWNGYTYWGHWEKVDPYHVRTTWENGGPPGSVWSLRETGDPASPYVASRGEP